MRTEILLCLCLVLLCSCPVLAGEPTVLISGYTVEPKVMMPGERGLITVMLSSTSIQASESESETWGTLPSYTRVKTRDVNPFVQSVYLGGGEVRVLAGNGQFEGEIGAGQRVNLSFLIQAPEKEGLYFMVLRVRVRDAESLICPIPVNVNMPLARRLPALILVPSAPEPVKPGGIHHLSIGVKNAGQAPAEEILIRVREENPWIATAGTGSFHLPRLEPNASSTIELALLTSRSASSGIQELPVSVQYRTPDGGTVTETESIGLEVRGESELVIRSVETDPTWVREGQTFDLIIRLGNTGTGEARSIRAAIDLPLQGIREAYIGTIRAGSDAPAVFTLVAEENGEMPYRMTVTYLDDWGEKSEEYSLTMYIAPAGGWNLTLAVLAVIAGLAIAVYWWRKRGTG